jgi:hypothetical protein
MDTPTSLTRDLPAGQVDTRTRAAPPPGRCAANHHRSDGMDTERPLEQAGSVRRRWLFNVAKQIVIHEWRSASRRREVVTDQLPEQTVEDATQRSLSGPA